jgi:hypothetical protein
MDVSCRSCALERSGDFTPIQRTALDVPSNHPHELDDAQQPHRVEVCRELACQNEN